MVVKPLPVSVPPIKADRPSRACDEIALIGTTKKRVFYGVDSLVEVIGYLYPIFKPLFSLKIFRHLSKKYILSFCRRVAG
jgi:hypothetical protein